MSIHVIADFHFHGLGDITDSMHKQVNLPRKILIHFSFHYILICIQFTAQTIVTYKPWLEYDPLILLSMPITTMLDAHS